MTDGTNASGGDVIPATGVRRRRRRMAVGDSPVDAKQEERARTLAELGLDSRYAGLTGATPTTAGEIMRAIALAHGKKHAMDYCLTTVYRMRLRGATQAQIAKEFNVSTSTVARWVNMLRERMRDEVKQLDPHLIIGEALSFYTEVRRTAMREFANAPSHAQQIQVHADGTETRTRIIDRNATTYKSAMLGHAVRAQDSLLAVLEKAGMFDALEPPGSQPLHEDTSLAEIMKDVLDGGDFSDGTGDGEEIDVALII